MVINNHKSMVNGFHFVAESQFLVHHDYQQSTLDVFHDTNTSYLFQIGDAKECMISKRL